MPGYYCRTYQITFIECRRCQISHSFLIPRHWMWDFFLCVHWILSLSVSVRAAHSTRLRFEIDFYWQSSSAVVVMCACGWVWLAGVQTEFVRWMMTISQLENSLDYVPKKKENSTLARTESLNNEIFMHSPPPVLIPGLFCQASQSTTSSVSLLCYIEWNTSHGPKTHSSASSLLLHTEECNSPHCQASEREKVSIAINLIQFQLFFFVSSFSGYWESAERSGGE